MLLLFFRSPFLLVLAFARKIRCSLFFPSSWLVFYVLQFVTQMNMKRASGETQARFRYSHERKKMQHSHSNRKTVLSSTFDIQMISLLISFIPTSLFLAAASPASSNVRIFFLHLWFRIIFVARMSDKYEDCGGLSREKERKRTKMATDMA